jgi:hypothetical protein
VLEVQTGDGESKRAVGSKIRRWARDAGGGVSIEAVGDRHGPQGFEMGGRRLRHTVGDCGLLIRGVAGRNAWCAAKPSHSVEASDRE